jgi:hypothetical protein
MTEQQYFTPEPEDFRIGFEFEAQDEDKKDWTKTRIKFQSELYNWLAFSDILKFRVPYLTREQIEAEGWIFDAQVTKASSRFYKGLHGIFFNQETYRLRVWGKCTEPQIQIFDGTCRCINDFRLISKLLNLNV